jgi:MFS family permease
MLTDTVFGGGYMTKDSSGKMIYDIEPGILGFISSCYQLGSIIAVPIVPWINRRYGRRWCIMIGSIIMIIGAILQGFAQNSEYMMLEHRLTLVLTRYQLACTSYPACFSVSVSCLPSSQVPP